MGFFPTDASDQDEIGPNANGSYFKYIAADDKWILIGNADVYSEAEVDALLYTDGDADARIALANHDTLLLPNGNAEEQHLTSAQQGDLHSDVIVSVANVQAVSINNVVEDATPQLGGPLDLNDKTITHELTAAVSLVAGNLCYMNGVGKMAKADADAEATCDTLLAMCLDTIAADATGTFLIFGKWTTSGLTAGVEYWVSETEGGITLTRPTTATHIVRHVGTSLSTTVLFFNPSHTYVEIVA